MLSFVLSCTLIFNLILMFTTSSLHKWNWSSFATDWQLLTSGTVVQVNSLLYFDNAELFYSKFTYSTFLPGSSTSSMCHSVSWMLTSVSTCLLHRLESTCGQGRKGYCRLACKLSPLKHPFGSSILSHMGTNRSVWLISVRCVLCDVHIFLKVLITPLGQFW